MKRALDLSMVKKIVLLFLLTFPTVAWAQGVLTGNVFDNTNRSSALEGAAVKNLSNKSIAVTDKDGHFAIPAKIGDLVSFGMAGYRTDTVYLINLFPKNVYLWATINSLNTVNITTSKVSPFLNTKDPNVKPSGLVNYSKERGGVRLALGYGRYKRDQEKIQALMEYDHYLEEINKNFTEGFVKETVKFEGPGLKDFMQLFRPTVDQVKAEQPFNYAYYTAKAYQAWLKLPVDQRKLPSLLKPKAKLN